MAMKAVIKARFNASKESFEKFGDDKYLVYLPFPEDDSSANVLINILSRKIGLPPSRIEYAGKDAKGNYIYELV
ncbi:hypothetical protein HYZ97_01845 [Candidatus Pacearchaeota archaeon]|nr:hypothetical protein [Candidatus Pacearchaeota archaeon]